MPGLQACSCVDACRNPARGNLGRRWHKKGERMHKLGSLFARGLAALVGATAFAVLVLSEKGLGSERCEAHGC